MAAYGHFPFISVPFPFISVPSRTPSHPACSPAQNGFPQDQHHEDNSDEGQNEHGQVQKRKIDVGRRGVRDEAKGKHTSVAQHAAEGRPQDPKPRQPKYRHSVDPHFRLGGLVTHDNFPKEFDALDGPSQADG